MGSLPASSAMKSKRAALEGLVDVAGGQGADAGLELAHPPGREAPRHQARACVRAGAGPWPGTTWCGGRGGPTPQGRARPRRPRTGRPSRGTRRPRRRGATGPRSGARRCGRPAPRPGAGRRWGTGPRGSRRSTGRRPRGPAAVATLTGQPSTRRVTSAMRSASSACGNEPMPAWSRAPEKARERASSTPASASSPRAERSRSAISTPICSRSRATSGSPASSAVVQAAASSGSSATTSAMSAMAADHPGGRRAAPVGGDPGPVLEPPPEHLGHQVVLGGEVGVGGGRGHARPAGHVAHGEALVAGAPDLLHRGVGQPGDGVGLALAQVAAHRRPRALIGPPQGIAGHGSGQ